VELNQSIGITAQRFLKIVLSVVGVLALGAGVAQAHHPNIEAQAVCDTSTNTVKISYDSFSWSTNGAEGENSQIDVYLDGTLVDSGAYVDPDYQFSGLIPKPLTAEVGDTVVVSVVAVADWGNGSAGGQSASTSVEIPDLDCGPDMDNGRFTGGGHQIRVDNVRVTRGLTIHCDLLLSNNLEINWLGNQFHTTEHLETIVCSDDPDIIQAPPPAPLDTLVAVGTGRYNNVDGFTIEFTLVDAGEPGSDDKARFLIYETANPGNVVLDVPLQKLTGGNLQAHFDQPHK
jgi:hypothetical protein